MTGVAIAFLILSIVIVWGGLAVSILFLRSRPEPAEYPRAGRTITAKTSAPQNATPDSGRGRAARSARRPEQERRP